MSQYLGIKNTEDDRLRQIARYTPGVIYQFRMRPDGSSCFPYASDGLLEVHGVSPVEVVEDSAKIFAFIDPEDIDRVIQSVQESAANMTPWYCEYRVNLPENRQLWLLCHSMPQRETDGSTLWHGYIRDITDSKTTEFALKASENRLLSIIENLNDMVYIINPDASFSYLSPQFREVMGYEIGELLNDSFAKVVHPEDLSICVKALQCSLQGEKVRGVEYRTLHKDGNYYWHSSNLSAMRNDAGEIIGCLGIARCIHDRKEAETKLNQVSDRLSLALKSGGIGCWEWDIVQNRVVWDDRMYELYGVDRKSYPDLAYDIWANWLYPDDRKLCEELIQQALLGNPEFNPQFRTIHPDGSIHFIEAFGLVQRDAEGNPLKMIGVNLDISDRKQTEILLQQSQKRYETLAEVSPIGVYLTDAKGDCLYVNQTWSQATGLTKEEALGPDWSRTLHPEDRDRVFQEWYATAQLRQPFQSEYRFLRPDSSIAWVIGQALPLIDQDGEVEGYVGTITDISDRKAAEAVLREYADRQTMLNQLVSQIRNSLDFDAVITTTIQAIRDILKIDNCAFAWYVDNQESPSWEVIQESKIAEIPSALGLYSCALIGPIVEMLFKQKIMRINDVSQYPEPIHRTFLEAINCKSEILLPIQTHAHRIGVIICINHLQVRPWTDSEVELLKSMSNQLAIAINQAELYAESRSKSQELQKTLQELQRTQTQMIQSEKMSSLGQLVGGIAHEVNNPISFIYGNIQPATDYVKELVDLVHLYQIHLPEPPQVIAKRLEEVNLEYLVQDFSRLLESMKNGAIRIRDIIRSLRTFSRLDEEGCKSIDIHENIESTLVVLQSRFNGRDGQPEIQLVKNYGDLPQIECYSGLLNQVFVNLLMNAIDSINESRAAHDAILLPHAEAILLRNAEAIEQRRNHLESPQHSQYQGVITITTTFSFPDQAIISIQDNGCGMNAQVQEKIFNPFFTTKPIGQGTGMGLAISYQIITENHQGNITVNSTAAKGTEFIITLPIKQLSYTQGL